MSRAGSRWRTGFPLILFVAAPVLARLYLLAWVLPAGDDVGSVLTVARGFLSDIAVGAALAVVVALLPGRWLLRSVVWTAWAGLLFLNVDQIFVNDGNLVAEFLDMALTEQFIRGSVLSARSALNVGLLTFASLLLGWLVARAGLVPTGRQLGSAAALGAGLLSVLPATSADAPVWASLNLAEDNLRRAVQGPGYQRVAPALSERMRADLFSQDLDGEPILEAPTQPQNVLLIVVEGVARWMVTPATMPDLVATAQAHLDVSRFVSLQRQSHRGMYAILCGDYSNFLGTEAKADIFGAGGLATTCLPAVLAEHGYQTALLLGTDAGYMQMGRFGRRAGFAEVRGGPDLAGPDELGEWGLDDGALLRAARSTIDRLHRSPAPWMVTVFTSGTHHPFSVPGHSGASRDEALAYLDRSIDELLDGLDRDGLLDDTLVVVTSDEASGGQGRGIERQLCINHAPLVVIPGGTPSAVRQDGIFSQRDLALSICDYVGLGGQGFPGRSVFRAYAGDRGVLFGNIYASRRFAYLPGGALYAHSAADGRWAAFQLPPGELFAQPLQRRAPDPAVCAELDAAFAFNERSLVDVQQELLYREVGQRRSMGGWLLGDLRVVCRRGDRLHWRLTVDPSTPVFALLRVDLDERFEVGFAGDHLLRMHPLAPTRVEGSPGSPLVLDYELVVTQDLEAVKSNLEVGPPGCGPFVIRELVVERSRAAT